MIGQINIDVNYNGNQPFRLDMNSLRQMNLMAGANGAGKSLANKWNWLISFSMQLYKITLLMQPQIADREFQKVFGQLIPLTFDISDLVSGCISVQDKKNEIYRLDVAFTDNDVHYINFDIKDPSAFNSGNIHNVLYNSGNTRTFDQYEKFIGLSKLTGIDRYMQMEDFEKVKDFYKIYEVLWFENMKNTILNWIDVGIPVGTQKRIRDAAETLKLGNNPNLYIKDASLYLKTDDRDCKLSQLSAGTQSFMMIVLFTGGE